MFRRLTCVVCVGGLALASAGRAADASSVGEAGAAPVNLTVAKAAVAAYVDDGRYEAEQQAVAARAEAWIRERATARRPGERLAVVLDVDETVLSNLGAMRAIDFGYEPERWAAWVARGEAPALAAGRRVFTAAREAGVAVLFLTGRREPEERAATEANLRREGMGDYAELRLTRAGEAGRTAAERKAAARAAWAEAGWTIIATVGDQTSDLAGGHAERAFKLPNPFYLIP